MRPLVILSLLMIASTGYAANAAESNYSDIDVISVAPRSSGIKPFVMAIFTKEQRQRIAAAAPKKVASGAEDLSPR